jgi:hypothetical protein
MTSRSSSPTTARRPSTASVWPTRSVPTRRPTPARRDRAIRAAASVLSPLGWHERDVRTDLAVDRDASLSAFSDP